MLPKTRAALQKNIRKEATSLPVAMEAQIITRTRQLALRAVNGDFDQLDLDNLDALGRIKGDLANTYIESISAAKITSATMLATTLTLAGTDASNNKTSLVMIGDATMRVNDGTADRLRLSNAGIEIGASDEGISPTVQAGRGIFNLGTKNSGITYFSNPSRRGWSIRSDGVGAGGVNGHLFLIATRAANAVATETGNWASLEAQIDHSGPGAISGRAGVILRNMLWCVGPARIGGDVDITGKLSADGSITTGAGLITTGAAAIGGGLKVSGTYQNDNTAATFGGGITSNTGNFAAPAGVALDIIGNNDAVNLRGSVIKSIAAFRAEAGLIVVGAASVSGTLDASGGISMPANSITATELQSHASDNTLRAVTVNHIRDNNVTLVKLSDAITGASTANGPSQGSKGTRKIGAFWGGTSVMASADNHGHSVSYKELPKDKREKIAASREKLHTSMISKVDMTLLTKEDLAKRLWLQERQMAAVLHLLCDDPGRPASVREADIVAGKEQDISISRYEEFIQAYEELHPTATQLFNGFTLEEMSA